MAEDARTIWWVLGGVLVAVLIIWIAISLRTSDSFEFNGFTFTETTCPDGEPCWSTIVYTNVGPRTVTFYSDPRELEYPIDRRAVRHVLNLTRVPNASITLAFDEGIPGEVAVAMVQVGRITGDKLYSIDTKGGIYGQDVTCADATPEHAVLYFLDAPTEGVVWKDNCILIGASSADTIVPVAELFTMHLLGIFL